MRHVMLHNFVVNTSGFIVAARPFLTADHEGNFLGQRYRFTGFLLLKGCVTSCTTIAIVIQLVTYAFNKNIQSWGHWFKFHMGSYIQTFNQALNHPPAHLFHESLAEDSWCRDSPLRQVWWMTVCGLSSGVIVGVKRTSQWNRCAGEWVINWLIDRMIECSRPCGTQTSDLITAYFHCTRTIHEWIEDQRFSQLKLQRDERIESSSSSLASKKLWQSNATSWLEQAFGCFSRERSSSLSLKPNTTIFHALAVGHFFQFGKKLLVQLATMIWTEELQSIEYLQKSCNR